MARLLRTAFDEPEYPIDRIYYTMQTRMATIPGTLRVWRSQSR